MTQRETYKLKAQIIKAMGHPSRLMMIAQKVQLRVGRNPPTGPIPMVLTGLELLQRSLLQEIILPGPMTLVNLAQ